MHDFMQYDPIQGQRKGHEPLKVENPSIFKPYLLRRLHFELTTDHRFLNQGKISKLAQTGFLIFVLVFCHVTLNLAETSVAKSRPSVLYKLIFLFDVIVISELKNKLVN